MKLEVGKTYLNGLGEKVFILKKVGKSLGNFYAFWGGYEDGNLQNCYTESGDYLLGDGEIGSHERDLISEVPS